MLYNHPSTSILIFLTWYSSCSKPTSLQMIWFAMSSSDLMLLVLVWSCLTENSFDRSMSQLFSWKEYSLQNFHWCVSEWSLAVFTSAGSGSENIDFGYPELDNFWVPVNSRAWWSLPKLENLMRFSYFSKP